MLSLFPDLGGLTSQAPLVGGPHACNGVGPGPLQFKSDGTFQISIFEDLHFGENAWEDWGPEQDRKSVKVISDVLGLDTPDLVVLNGDLITDENGFLENATVYVDQIVGPIVERGLPWAATYGNHDYQYNLSGPAILERERRHKGSLTRNMVHDPRAGVTNYFLPVYPHGSKCGDPLCNMGLADNNDDERLLDGDCIPELLLWFFDSRGGFRFQEKFPNGDQVGHENWVHPSAVSWFRRTHAKLTYRFGGRIVPSLAFTHIPVHAAHALQKENGRDSIDPNRFPGINDDYPVAQQSQGWCPDATDGECEYGGLDVPFMKALVEIPGIMALFFAHDHGDSWCARWDRLLPGMNVEGSGIALCYGQHSGYGGYGRWVRGARQVLASREMLARREVDTWIRLETGDVVGAVSLNGTFGQDLYPATPNDESPRPKNPGV